MVTVTNIRNIKDREYDEVWAVVRSSKNLPEGVIHVPELSPSWKLFAKFQELKKKGNWNKETFMQIYLPQFLLEMKAPAAKGKLKELMEKSNQGKHICIYCFCTDQSLCHTSVLAGILQLCTKIDGTSADYSAYGVMYESAPVKGTLNLKSVCFTGHRPMKLCGYVREKYQPFIDQLVAILEVYYNYGVRTFITGGAQGFDQLAFWAIHRLKRKYPDIRNIVYVPFKGYGNNWNEFGCFGQSDYKKMLAHADKVIYLQDYEPLTKRAATSALYYRNERMVDDVDAVIALQNGDDWRTAYGGTAGCMQYAAKRAKPMHRIICQTKPYLSIERSEAI